MDSIFGRKKKPRVPTTDGLLTSSNDGSTEVIGSSTPTRGSSVNGAHYSSGGTNYVSIDVSQTLDIIGVDYICFPRPTIIAGTKVKTSEHINLGPGILATSAVALDLLRSVTILICPPTMAITPQSTLVLHRQSIQTRASPVANQRLRLTFSIECPLHLLHQRP